MNTQSQPKTGHTPMTVERALEIRRLVAADARPATWTPEEGAEAVRMLKQLEAAAPKLLTACEALLAKVQSEHHHGDWAYQLFCDPETVEEYRNMKASLKQAKGEG